MLSAGVRLMWMAAQNVLLNTTISARSIPDQLSHVGLAHGRVPGKLHVSVQIAKQAKDGSKQCRDQPKATPGGFNSSGRVLLRHSIVASPADRVRCLQGQQNAFHETYRTSLSFIECNQKLVPRK